MRLATLAGLSVAPVRLAKASGKEVLLVERFDRMVDEFGWQRRAMVSALTMLGLDEMQVRYARYQGLAETNRFRFRAPKATLHELFGLLTLNILVGNTTDIARTTSTF